ncbi:MgtC/SapB family protein [Geothrix sp. PMB-07]|uniref:MgtC/SapB family protein n=1 Tax=Geothrix sp. PMB-07 TaxID=3068640 RepID=UPI0027406975|nr:MgtC/SapB family protein [Geothrix sp. PMB-07]WLT33316.1 MgtC/SapB family protein [Geothrix sp. PMB-07]
MLSLDISTLKEAVLAVAVGLMMGLERERSGFERSQEGHEEPFHRRESDQQATALHGSLGARTFALLTLLGWIAVKVGGENPAMPIAVMALAALMIGLFYYETSSADRGLTTEIAALSAPLLGMLLTKNALLAVAVAVIVTLLLLSKPWIRAWVPKLQREDLTASIQLLIVFAILLPLLPSRALDPWGVLSPRKVGWMVALIAAVDFLGYALNRVLGSRRGAALTGLVGGLISSTVVTVTMSRQAREDASLRGPGQVAVMLACAVMGLRVTMLAGVIGGAALAKPLLLPMGAMVLVLLGASYGIYRASGTAAGVGGGEMPVRNPFHLKRAMAWGLALAAVLLVSAAARAWFGDRGLLIAAGVSGLADVDPITLAVSSQVREVGLSATTAVLAIILAIGANTFAKAAFAWISGGRAFGQRLAAILGGSLAAALLVAWLLR